MRLKELPGRFAVAAALAAGACSAGALTGCTAHAAHNAGVAATFNNSTMPPLPSPSPSPSPAVAAPPSANSSAAAPKPSTGSGATPCPPPAPQIFVEGKSSTQTADGGVTFSYLDAQRLCDGPDDVQFATTGKKLNTAPVTSSAVVRLLPPAGGTRALAVPVAALPAAMAANKSAPYYAITVDTFGAITGIEQYFHP